MTPPNDRLFGAEEIRHIVREEVAAYYREDTIHAIMKAGCAIMIVLIGAAIFIKAGGFV